MAQFSVEKSSVNESDVGNLLNREFHSQEPFKVIVSDLTYVVRVQQKWHYICVLVDLYNREIIGYSAGANKDAALVHRAFSTIQCDLHKLEMFHTDRGKEFDNELIDEALETFQIQRSLSEKGSPYDNVNCPLSSRQVNKQIILSHVCICIHGFLYAGIFNPIFKVTRLLL